MTQMSNDEKQQFKILLSEIKTLYSTGSLNQESKAIISELLIVLKYKVEYTMMSKIISENVNIKELEELIEDLNNRILEYKDTIYEKNKESDNKVMPRNYLIGLISMENNLRRLKELRGIIKTRNYNSYIQMMNEQVKSTNQLMLIAQSVLSDGYNEYFSSKLIEDGNINENVMTIIYSILKDNDLYNELSEYISSEKELDEISKSIEDDKNKRELFIKIMEHESDLRRYIILNSRVKKSQDTIEKINESISDNDKKIESLSNQKYLRFLFNGQIRQLETENIQKNAASMKLMKDKVELEELENKFISLGFEEIISSFKTEIIDVETLCDKFVIFIKTKVNNKSIDISEFLSSLDSRIEKKERELDLKTKLLPKKISKCSPLSRKLLLGYKGDVEKIISLNEEEKDLSKLVAFYVLNLLCSTNKLRYEDLFDLDFETEKYEELLGKLETVINEEVAEMNESVRSLETEFEQVVRKAV